VGRRVLVVWATDAALNAVHRGSRPGGVVAPRRTRETARPAQHRNHDEAVHDHCGGIPSKSGCVCNCCVRGERLLQR
jgi:hypothetical protein